MKQKNKKFLNIFLILLCAIAIIGVKPTVFAKDETKKDTDPTEEQDKEKPKPKKDKCTKVNGLDRYNPNVYPSYHSNGEIYTLEVNNGTFDVYVYEIKYNDATGETWPDLREKFTMNNSKQYTFKRASVPINYDFVFNLKSVDDLCDVDPLAEPKRKSDGTWEPGSNVGYVFSHSVEVPAAVNDPYFTNIHYNGICSALRTGDYNTYATQFTNAGLSKTDFDAYRTKVLENFSYCNNHLVTVSYKENEVAKLIRNIIAGFKISETNINGELKGPQNNSEIIPESASTSISMQCPAYKSDSNGNVIPNKTPTDKYYYKTVTTVQQLDIYTTVENDASCEKTCEENVTVTYGPPVATKAGLCFEYKVKVKSELNCVTKFEGKVPTPDDYNVCTPIGACNSMAYLSASGPNDDFDKCVNSCDGGKYTEKCVDSCYKDVYEDNTNTLLPINYNTKLTVSANAISNVKASKLTKEDDARYDDILKAIDNIGDGKKYTIDDLKFAIIEASTGRYSVNSSKSIVWNPGKRYWEKPGRYFTLNITNYTVGRLKTAGGHYWNTVWNQGGLSIVDNQGFLRNNSGGSGYCGATCSWYGCQNAKENAYYQGKRASNREFLNSDEAIEVYLEEFANYENAAKECKASAACTTQESEFTIKVNNKIDKDDGGDNWIEYKAGINEAGNFNGTTVNGKGLSTTIILDKSGCYNKETATGNAKYMTEWSFPGTWVNNKTGVISYEQKDDNAWHFKKDKFCTNLDSKHVNTKWWEHRVLQSSTNFPPEAQALIDEYNIIATARDFGYFKWDFDINCFYALYDNMPKDDSPSSEKPEDIIPLSYKARPIELTDIFPNNDTESPTENPNDTGRNQGFNWTDSASNVKNASYEITPGALYPEIQKRGSEIYNPANNDLYLDYEFYLTPSDLNTIRKYSESDGNGKYNSYPGRINVKNGVAYYESALFRASSTSSYRLDTKSIITLGALGVNNQERKGGNSAEIFGNTYTASLISSRDEYLSSMSGGTK